MSRVTIDSSKIEEEISSRGSTEKECVVEDPTEKLPLEVIQDAQIITSRGNVVTKDGIVVSVDESDASLATNVFSDPEVAAHYRKVYEDANYECRHAFDPDMTWSEEEERRLVRSLDWKVCMWAIIMFFGMQLDRGNMSLALGDNFLNDLNLSTDDYNTGSMIGTICFLCAELPSQLVSKKIGPERWIPIQMVLWSIVAMSQSALSGRQGYFATRAILALLEGGFIPDIVLWMSYFYTSRELPMRLSYFWTTISLTSIFSSLFAYAVFHLRQQTGWAGWRWLFVLEGSISLIVGISSWFMMPASAAQTKNWFRPNGWFTDRELGIVVNRVLRDDPSKGDMNNHQAVTPRRLWNALKDYDLWPIYILGFTCFIPLIPPSSYTTLTLKNLKFSTFNTTLLTIPFQVAHIITMLLLTYLSEYLNERTFVSMIMSFWTLPCIIALRFWPGTMVNQWGTYAIVFALLSYPYCHPILVGWASKNSNNVGSRSVSTALYNICVQLGSLCGNYIYVSSDAPAYRNGNTKLIIINILAIVLFLSTKLYYVLRNKFRDRKWEAMTQEQKAEYISSSKDVGTKRLDFRFAH